MKSHRTNGSAYLLGSRRVHRVGFGAMQLPGSRVFGPSLDRQQALDVLRYAVAAGVDHAARDEGMRTAMPIIDPKG
jgi:pyridoxine 4-dehydrogenase